MRALTTFVAVGVMALASFGSAWAQPDGYGRGGWRPDVAYGPDPCHAARREAGEHGAVTGGLLGALAGSLVAGHGSRLGGALVGGAVGAVAGNQIARSKVRCVAYPYGYRPHRDCRWVDENGHGFEICRGRDGVWRPWEPRY